MFFITYVPKHLKLLVEDVTEETLETKTGLSEHKQ